LTEKYLDDKVYETDKGEIIMDTKCKHGVDFAEYTQCKECDYEEISELKEELEACEKANDELHEMIMQIRTHFNAWDTPTAPNDQDIVDCIIRNAEKDKLKYLELLQKIRKDIVEGVYGN
jgi:hypothetical protein